MTTTNQSPITAIIAERAAKLERIRPLISLKSYDLLVQKLSAEKTIALGESNRAERATEKRERAQALPKTLFTERTLPRKAIRID